MCDEGILESKKNSSKTALFALQKQISEAIIQVQLLSYLLSTMANLGILLTGSAAMGFAIGFLKG
jgi:hypothetical protein